MEFLRFGSSIPGKYWGCCAIDIIQDFKFDPDEKASIQIVSGDSGSPITRNGRFVFAGPTYKDIFRQRLRIGTFSDRDMPNHAFFATMTEYQATSCSIGKKWLRILKEEGFIFIGCVDNSVYSGDKVVKKPGTYGKKSPKRNYIFMLLRNIGEGAIPDPFTPPDFWTSLPDPYGGDLSPDNMQKVQLELWDKLGKPKLLTEEEVVKAKAPVILAGLRSAFPPQTKGQRDDALSRVYGASKAKKADPFAVSKVVVKGDFDAAD